MSHEIAVQLMEYSFLVAFAKDGHMHKDSLDMMERIALKDGKIDDEEKEVLTNIFAHARRNGVSDRVEKEISAFCEKYAIA